MYRAEARSAVGPRGASNEEDPDRRIRVDGVDMARERVEHRARERIQPVGPIEGQHGDAVFEGLEADGGVVGASGHRMGPPVRVRVLCRAPGVGRAR